MLNNPEYLTCMTGEHFSKVYKNMCWYGFETRSCLNHHVRNVACPATHKMGQL